MMNANSPTSVHNAHSGGSPITLRDPAAEAIGFRIVTPGELQKLFLPIWQPAPSRDAAKPMRQLTVVLPGLD